MRKKYSVRALTVMGVKCFEYYCEKREISHGIIDEFCAKMLTISTAEDIKVWSESCNSLTMKGQGEELPEALIEAYPKHAKRIRRIVERLRDVTKSQLFGANDYRDAYINYRQLERACRIKASKITDVSMFKEHGFTKDDFVGTVVPNELLIKWGIRITSQSDA